MLQQYEYASKVANLYHNSLYRPVSVEDSQPARPFFDSFANSSFAPPRPMRNDWTYIRTDFRIYDGRNTNEPFHLFLSEIQAVMGHTDGIQVPHATEPCVAALWLRTLGRQCPRFELRPP